jgi:hypothetical protein
MHITASVQLATIFIWLITELGNQNYLNMMAKEVVEPYS